MEPIPREEFARMSLNERLGYPFGAGIRYRRLLIDILNDPEEPDRRKFLYALVLADGLARIFECMQEIFELRQMLSILSNVFR